MKLRTKAQVYKTRYYTVGESSRTNNGPNVSITMAIPGNIVNCLSTNLRLPASQLADDESVLSSDACLLSCVEGCSLRQVIQGEEVLVLFLGHLLDVYGWYLQE